MISRKIRISNDFTENSNFKDNGFNDYFLHICDRFRCTLHYRCFHVISDIWVMIFDTRIGNIFSNVTTDSQWLRNKTVADSCLIIGAFKIYLTSGEACLENDFTNVSTDSRRLLNTRFRTQTSRSAQTNISKFEGSSFYISWIPNHLHFYKMNHESPPMNHSCFMGGDSILFLTKTCNINFWGGVLHNSRNFGVELEMRT
jgi:hypothetical protein